jgi:hypothetical protein
MNYLVIEGYKDAAECFQRESGTERIAVSRLGCSASRIVCALDGATEPAGLDLNSVSERMAIRNAVQSGAVEEGIARVNELNPQVRVRLPLFACSLPLSAVAPSTTEWSSKKREEKEMQGILNDKQTQSQRERFGKGNGEERCRAAD